MAGDLNVSVDELFEEFVEGWALGEDADVGVLLERAGPERDQLAGLVDAFLQRAPRREPSEESKLAIAALTAHAEPPLLTARVAARLKVRDVVRAIVAACGLPSEAEPLVHDYYQRLELGLLEPRGVADKVWAALEKAVSPSVRKLADLGYPFRPPATAAGLAFQRLADSPAPAAPAPAAAPSMPSEAEREVERLFTGAGSD
jgi:hypothetical protein